MLHKNTDGTILISASQVWRPGRYESEKVARKAQRLDDSILQSLQDAANLRGDEVITNEDIVCYLNTH
jgi:hypothetical protein